MRQGQQNRRGRGRNRKTQNPMTRSFESTGPDVKLRGTASHVAEKYMSLARDALSSGDPVLAENYMQHAEHYNRIIMTFREQQMSQGGGDPFASGMGRPASMGGDMDEGDDFGDEEGGDFGGAPVMGQPDMQQPMPPPQPQMQQPRSFDQGQRYENNNNRHHNNQNHRRDNRHHNNRHDRGENRFDRGDRQDRGDFRSDRGGDRGDRNGDRNYDRNNGAEPRGFRDDRSGGAPQVGEGGFESRPPRRERFQPQPAADQPAAAVHEQPEFLRRPVRRPRNENSEGSGAAAAAPAADDQE